MEDIKGLVFDIEEFAVFDGPGIRIAIFLKGCPLRCNWCHNPEGLQMCSNRMVSRDLCIHCGRCSEVCPTPSRCTACGTCVSVCPRRCISIAGQWMSAREVANHIARNAQLLQINNGGITFSGGECTVQSDFVLAVRALLPDLHAAIETCGHVDSEIFERIIRKMDLVMFDIKHTDTQLHKKYTGVGNELIHDNLDRLIASGVSFRARIPLIPGVNDTEENMEQTAQWLMGAKNLERVELLLYNHAAGAKYKSLGLEYTPAFDDSVSPKVFIECLRQYRLETVVL